MAVTIAPVTESFAAEIGDVDLSLPLGSEDEAAIKAAFWKYAVLVFPAQDLAVEQQLAFAARFGPLESATNSAYSGIRGAHRVREEIADVSNLALDGSVWGRESRQRKFQLGNRLWHTDSSFKPVPALASFLYARSIPPVGGQTEFADERAAWEALTPEMKRRVEGLIAEHSILTSRAKLGFTDFSDEERRDGAPVRRPMVRKIPESGRTTLYLASHAGRVLDMDETEGRALIERLVAHATQRQFVYTHRWRVGDLVVWDNRCTMHRGLAFDDLRWKRDVQRATVSDVAGAAV